MFYPYHRSCYTTSLPERFWVAAFIYWPLHLSLNFDRYKSLPSTIHRDIFGILSFSLFLLNFNIKDHHFKRFQATIFIYWPLHMSFNFDRYKSILSTNKLLEFQAFYLYHSSSWIWILKNNLSNASRQRYSYTAGVTTTCPKTIRPSGNSSKTIQTTIHRTCT